MTETLQDRQRTPDVVQPRSPGAGDLDPVSGSGERLAHLLLDHGWVVIDEQQMGHGSLAPAKSGGRRQNPLIVKSLTRPVQPRERLRTIASRSANAFGTGFALVIGAALSLRRGSITFEKYACACCKRLRQEAVNLMAPSIFSPRPDSERSRPRSLTKPKAFY